MGGRAEDTFAFTASLLAACASEGGKPSRVGAINAARIKLCSAGDASGNTSSCKTCSSNNTHTISVLLVYMSMVVKHLW